MSRPPPKNYVPTWWKLALDDGKHCENKRRERYFVDYLEDAIRALESAGMLPVELQGPFRMLYRRGFRLGYDNAALMRTRNGPFLSRARKRAKLGK